MFGRGYQWKNNWKLYLLFLEMLPKLDNKPSYLSNAFLKLWIITTDYNLQTTEMALLLKHTHTPPPPCTTRSFLAWVQQCFLRSETWMVVFVFDFGSCCSRIWSWEFYFSFPFLVWICGFLRLGSICIVIKSILNLHHDAIYVVRQTRKLMLNYLEGNPITSI